MLGGCGRFCRCKIKRGVISPFILTASTLHADIAMDDEFVVCVLFVLFYDDQGWPATGAIKLERVQMRYRPGLDLVLKGVTLDVKVHSRRCGLQGSGSDFRVCLTNLFYSFCVSLYILIRVC